MNGRDHYADRPLAIEPSDGAFLPPINEYTPRHTNYHRKRF